MAAAEENSVRWTQHRSNLQTMFASQLDQNRFCDITLASDDGLTLAAHRNVLCAGSQYFDRLLAGHQARCNHDLLVIVTDCAMAELRLLVDFIYTGEINVETKLLPSLYRAARCLQVKGLVEPLKAFLSPPPPMTTGAELAISTTSATSTVNAMPVSVASEEARIQSADLRYIKDNFERMLGSQQQVFAALKRTDHQIEQLAKKMGQSEAIGAQPEPLPMPTPPPTATATSQKPPLPPIPINPSLYTKTFEYARKFNPISKLDQLVELETKLKDETYWNEVVDAMKSICGVNCNTEGYNCCYILVDHFFTREFMHTCSWSGGSRSDVRKNEFRSFERTIRLFSQLVLMADSRFSETQVHQFFVRILKNSTQRLQVRRRSVMRPRRGRRKQRHESSDGRGRRTNDGDAAYSSMREGTLMDGDGDCTHDENGSQPLANDLFESHAFKVEGDDDEVMIDNGDSGDAGCAQFDDSGEGASWMG